MEKNRRAQLKECFEQLKKQLPNNETDKKSSNLSILGNACRTVQVSYDLTKSINICYSLHSHIPLQTLKRKERELEHEMERLAKEKVAQQKRMLILRREMAAHTDQDPSFFLSDNEVASLGVGGNLRERCKPLLSQILISRLCI